MEIEGFHGSLYSVLCPDPLTQRSCPGFHIAVGCGLLYGVSQPEVYDGDDLHELIRMSRIKRRGFSSQS